MDPDDRSQQELSEQEKADAEVLRMPHRHKGRAERLWKPLKLHLTERYNYITRNPFLRILHYLLTWLVLPPIYLFLLIYWRFHVRGRANLKPVRKRAAISVSNHIHDVDALMVTNPYWPNTPYIVARKHNLEVFLLGIFNRSMRAVPLPDDMDNFVHFSNAIDNLLRTTKHKLHIFPEGEIEPYARDLRKFGNGAFHFAVTNGVPIVPMVFVSPGPGRVELIIGKVIEPDSVPGTEEMNRPRKVRALATHTRKVMEGMLSDYYDSLGNSPGKET